MLLENETDVLEARKIFIQKLNTQKEVENVDKVYVDKNEAFTDINNLNGNSVNIFLSTKEDSKLWNYISFRRKLFSKCYLWEIFKRKEENRLCEMRAMVFLV